MTDFSVARGEVAGQALPDALTGSLPIAYTQAPGVNRIPTLAALLDDFQLHYRSVGQPVAGAGVLAWGRRPSALAAQRYAQKHGLAVYHVEDGFLRSVGLGKDDPPLAIVFDDVGLYLDASQPSRLESLIAQPLRDDQIVRARALAAAWRDGRVSKYNHSRDLGRALPDGCVLVVDQTRGDASISCGLADAASFHRMLEAALHEHPDRTILLKVHPDVVSGRKHGHFDLDAVRAMPRVQVLDDNVHPASLLPLVREVYTVTSQLGFEALMWGLPVRVFGMPFYAGWGLTRDALPAPARRGAATLEQLVHAALIDYCRYVDPETGKRCEVETVLAWLALQRRMRQRFPVDIDALGFSGWKKDYVRQFFDGSAVRFRWRVPRAIDRAVATWGRKLDDRLAPALPATQKVIRVEDGFVRSVGLGADLTRPLSWVQDDVGIYYDATRPSQLETLLAQTAFTPDLLARAAALRQAICDAGITKYNLGGHANWVRPEGRRVILVPGQVETDASIRFGASGIRGNMDLLQAVRAANPDAYLLYKPHPDVMAGLRKVGRGEDDAARWCDETIGSVSFHQLLGSVDEVHVLTSLAGFEALLRGVKVVTYGQPFYAGWGVSHDAGLTEPVRQRRNRVLTLDELVAAALILYPTYVSRTTKRFTTPERALQELVEWRAMPRVPRWRHWVARLFREA
ncbi:capsular polysaccharide biosynthesis protein [Burkholderia sp. IDO3]|uniref:capsular polysaccharide biosynthesis protein n=1 Tax=Burkholderia sp. IDO3 TaxID=1705310 RepID=UPI000BBAEABF|nr:capsular polysaccharide biosynthesis protein [Burkholderia sp. IDO3]AXK64593.1 capsular polysaccharide biosynthesis protein [Burkholderia sp. IDO3]PCD60595.1 beta-3-deoxy-D-manno-oct-2-ulosonic acid transferase [Burkholderia sp. IDO3]